MIHSHGMDIRLIVSDIDGTLLASKNDLRQRTEEEVRKFIGKKDYIFTISTGRPFQHTLPLVEYFNLDTPFIYSSGAIYDPRNNKVISARPIPDNQIALITGIANKFRLGMILHSETGMYCLVNDRDWKIISAIEWMQGKRVEHATRIGDIKTDIPGKIIRFDIFSEESGLENAYQAISQQTDDVLAVLMQRSIEISHQKMHKGSALQILAKLLNIPLEKTMAVGDSLNDIPLLQEAGVGVAMGTAPDALKDIADIVVSSADEEGLIQALNLAW